MKKISRYFSILLSLAVISLIHPGTLYTPLVGGISYTATLLSQKDSLTWQRPRIPERQDERHKMVERYLQQAGNRDFEEDVLEAMRHVPRHLFVPQNVRGNAYQNRPLPIGSGQTISQPYIVAYMTDLLDITAGDKVLEIGTGSGYQAAVLSEITPNVYTIEIIESLAEKAEKRFGNLGYNTIRTNTGDGYYGWEKFAPFDVIIVTAAAGHVPPPLVNQLKQGGRMVIPLGNPYQTQTLVLVTKDEAGEMRTKSLLPVRFVPMTGEVQEKN